MSGRSFSLTDYLSKFIDHQVAKERHQNVREALRPYQDDVQLEESNLAALERVAEAGIAAIEDGDYICIKDPEDRRALLERWLNDGGAAAPGNSGRRG